MNDQARLLELQREQWHRKCRSSLVAFAIEALAPRGETPALHHRLICAELQAVALGHTKRLMILAPPGSAKTTYTSRIFPAWYFAFRPRHRGQPHAGAQRDQQLHVQRLVRDNENVLGYGLATDAKGRWSTTADAAYLAGSVGSAILGFRANVAIIDDPIKSRAEAESETVREHTWTWFTNDLLTRPVPSC
jgi:hypothetical protein